MTLGRYDYDRRYRRRFRRGFIKVLFFVVLLLGVGLFSYQMGIEQLKARDATLREEIATLSRQKAELELVAGQMQHAARVAEGRAGELEARLQREVPTGDLATIANLAAERLQSGLDAKRLAFVISHAQTPRDCQQAETKRFTVTTPLLRTGNRSTTFGSGKVVVTAEGKSARDPKGSPESWFDPAEPVTIKITTIGGKESIAEGVLPLQHAVIAEDMEYRFTFSPGQRSFIEVTADRCPFP